MPYVRHLIALLGSLCLLAGLARAQPAELQATGDRSTYDDATKASTLTGHARLVNGDTVLTADEIRYNSVTGIATATGHFVLSSGPRRLVADIGTYNLQTRIFSARNLRLGEFPVYLSGDTVAGTVDEMVFSNATVFFRENAGYTPSLHARRLTYAHGKIVSAEGLSLGLLGGRIISLHHFEQALDGSFVSYLSATAGYRGNIGLFTQLGLHVPLTDGVQFGGDLGLYSARGLMIGPSGTYRHQDDTRSLSGSLRSGYIYDLGGNRGTGILGDPVPRNRSFVTWQQQAKFGDRFSLDGQLNYWSDSEILRDFSTDEFNAAQQPDSFLEAAYGGNNYAISAFARANPNPYQLMVQRLPELRFDLLPAALALGAYGHGSASAAMLESAAVGPTHALRTRRLDAYYAVERPLTPVPWFNFTPVVGGRITHYTNALGGQDTYTRTLGEIGFDAHLLASGTFDYKNPAWEIDGLRHLIEPKLSYRYAPEAATGQAQIPPVDTTAFTTYLPPLSIGDSRTIDRLTALNTFRLSLANTFQTRDLSYGSRNLATLDFAADYRFARTARTPALSDIYTEFAVTPAPWLKWEVFHRFDPHAHTQQELNTAVELVDQEWWSVRLATHFLKHNYEQYYLEYHQRLNEVLDATALWRYDARDRRFTEQSYGLTQRLGQTWSLRYEISFFSGNLRSSRVALNLEVELLKF